MTQSQPFKHTAYLLFAIGFLNVLAEIFYFHWTIWWYDTMLHVMGGAAVAMFILSAYLYYFNKSPKINLKFITFVLVGVLVVGILWEIFELYFNLTSLDDGIIYKRDTISDLIADMVGGLIGVVYSFQFFGKMNDRIQ